MNKKLDPELLAYFYDIKDQISEEHRTYFAAHPEIRQLLTDYLLKVMLTKPENTYEFAKNYFQFFEKRTLRQNLKHLLVVSPPRGGRSKLARLLVQAYPQYFELSVTMTTHPYSPEVAQIKSLEVVQEAQMEEEAALGNLLQENTVSGVKTAISKAKLGETLGRGKVCILNMDIPCARKLLDAHPDFNVVVVIPGSLETLKERLLNSGRYGLGTIDEAMTSIKHELEESAKEVLFNKRILNITTDRSFEQLMLLMKIFYKQFKF